MKNYEYTFFVYFLYFIMLSFLIYQFFCNNVIYCDGSFDSTTIIDGLKLSDHLTPSDQSTRNDETNANCSTIITGYQDMVRRRLYWYSCVKGKGNFSSYTVYKQSWDPSTRVLHEIKKGVNKDIEDIKHKVYLTKRTLDWIFKPSTRGGGRSGRGNF